MVCKHFSTGYSSTDDVVQESLFLQKNALQHCHKKVSYHVSVLLKIDYACVLTLILQNKTNYATLPGLITL